jgi:hypothetical protein
VRNSGAGVESLHVAVDDHSRLAFACILPDEKIPSVLNALQRSPTADGWERPENESGGVRGGIAKILQSPNVQSFRKKSCYLHTLLTP